MPAEPPRSRRVDPAVASARGVVAMYGDPTVSWSIAIDVSMFRPVEPSLLAERCGALASGHPHLGRPAVPVTFPTESAGDLLSTMLDRPYGDQDPLVRVGLSDDGYRLLLAAHHGVIDGLGLLAALSILLDTSVTCSAKGIGSAQPEWSFVRSSLSRLREAALSPPSRLAAASPRSGTVERPAHGDVVSRRDLPPLRLDTSAVVAASTQAFAEWNERNGARNQRVVVAIGASRRDGSHPRPDRATAYFRVRLSPKVAVAGVRSALLAAAPEPAFPERRVGRLATIITRSMRSRLGSSLFVSNLGLVTGRPLVERIALYASAAGPRALAVSVASTDSCTTVTARLPRADFSTDTADAICDLIVERLSRIASGD